MFARLVERHRSFNYTLRNMYE